MRISRLVNRHKKAHKAERRVIQLRIPGAIDLARAALAQQRDFVGAEVCADRDGHEYRRNYREGNCWAEAMR